MRPDDVAAPPSDVEAERALLGCILQDNTLVDEVHEAGLRAEDFYAPAHARIYRAIITLAKNGSPADIVTLAAHFGDDIVEVGGAHGIAALYENVITTVNAASYARIVRETADRRRTIAAMHELLTAASSGNIPLPEALESTAKAIYEIQEGTRGARPIPRVAELLADAFAELERRQRPEYGVSPGLSALNDLIGRLEPGQLYLLCAAPGSAKSALALHIARHVASYPEHAAAIANLEMDDFYTIMRLLSRETGVDFHSARRFNAEEARLAAQGAEAIAPLNLYIDNLARASAASLAVRWRRLKRRAPLSFAVVDYVDMLDHPGDPRQMNVSDRMAATARKLKQAARELEIAVMGIWTMNKERRVPGWRPSLADLRQIGGYEADCALFLYEERRTDDAVLWIEEVKGRHVGKGRRAVAFDGATMRFSDRDQPADAPAKKEKRRWIREVRHWQDDTEF